MQNYSINDFLVDIKSLSDLIKNSGNNYDCICAITRGGLAGTSWLAQSLNIKEIYTAGGKYIIDGSFQYSSQINNHINGNVLMVSDLCRSGKILEKIRGDIHNFPRVKEVDIACIHYFSNTSVLQPKFYVYEINEVGEFIEYPWER